MKIVVVSKGDPKKVKTWSGIPYYIYDALRKKGHTVEGINLIDPEEPAPFKWYRRINYMLTKRWFWSEMEPYILKRIGAQFDEEVNRIQPDVVVLIHGHFLTYTTFKQPTIVVHDTTFAQLINYYPEFTRFTPRTIQLGNSQYKQSLNQAVAAVFSSDWATQSAITDYHTSPSKVYTIPFGANLSCIPGRDDVAQWIRQRAKNSHCDFLFIGIEWERKGGPDALRFVAELNRLGIPSRLTIVGCTPDIPEKWQRYANQIGYLRKDVDAEAEKLNALFQTSTALLLPSLAECYGCVYCEANAYGLPALGRDTGGVSEIIKEGTNGLLMQAHESPEAFAVRWASVWQSRAAYADLSDNARNEFDDRLNYDVFVNRLEEIIVEKKREGVEEFCSY